MNTNISATNVQKTMSSTEIAQLTGKLKNHIHRDIKEQILMGLYGLKDGPNMDRTDLKGVFIIMRDNGQIQEIQLDRYHTDILMSGYEVKYRAAIVKRWHELEEAVAIPQQVVLLPGNYIEALEKLLETEKDKQKALEHIQILEPQLEAANHKIEEDKPKVEFAISVRTVDGTCTVTEFAKAIGFGRNRFYDELRRAKILMRNNQPYQGYIDRGLFIYPEVDPWIDPNGKSHPAFETRITGKGQIYLERKFRKGEAA